MKKSNLDDIWQMPDFALDEKNEKDKEILWSQIWTLEAFCHLDQIVFHGRAHLVYSCICLQSKKDCELS